MTFSLTDFIAESNRIEGIVHRAPSDAEIEAHVTFCNRRLVRPADLVAFVSVVAPGHTLRNRVGLNVRVGNHVPPPGSPEIEFRLGDIVNKANEGHGGFRSAYDVHCAYETLHPFTDGNGRSGRALWLWMMGGIERTPLGFLHHWYYHSLR